MAAWPTCGDAALAMYPSRQQRPKVISFNAAICANEKGGQWQHAPGLLVVMRLNCMLPKLISYSSAISATEKGWRWLLGLVVETRHWPCNLHHSNDCTIGASSHHGLQAKVVGCLRLTFSIKQWRWEAGLEHQPGPRRKIGSAAVQTYRRAFRASAKAKPAHASTIDTPTARQQQVIHAAASTPMASADHLNGVSLPSAGPPPPRQWVILESKNVTSLASYFAGLANRGADITCTQ